jgi:DNA-binding response OmpR family regulator
VEDDRTSHSGEPAGAQAPGATLPPHRILVVDDDISIRQLSTEVLIHSGYAVDAAEDGAVAWDTLQLNHYDLLITDQNMPKISGLELVRRLRAARMALPVILVSGVMPKAELDRHPRLQIEATLLKPYTFTELLGMVQAVLGATDRNGGRTETPLPMFAESPEDGWSRRPHPERAATGLASSPSPG